MPKLLRFFLLLIAFSFPLFWFWMEWGQTGYQKLMGAVIVPAAKALGEKELNLFVLKAHYINAVPLVALILATPAFGWKKRLAALAFGVVFLFAWHLFFSLVLNHYQTLWGRDRRFYRLFIPAISINSAVPVILWLVLAWQGAKELLGEIFARPKE
ncbi:MAG: hypothetical protein L0Z48_11865 [candidate division Zixibacteria bacterium]|nr:hypothetical protein [candidate division Zixibacteria bacterium]MCI0597220.1 hypothetical protein [candidate division Zixibacteria bacterium]